EDEQHPRFRELVALDVLRAALEPAGMWELWGRFWDTGEKAWFDAAVCDRAVHVATPDFRHIWHGSSSRRFSEAALLAEYPEVRPFLERASARCSLSVEGCRFRESVRPSPAGESAECGLVRHLTGAAPGAIPAIPRAACESCVASYPVSTTSLNPVVAALLYEASGQVGDPGQAARLRSWAEAELDGV